MDPYLLDRVIEETKRSKWIQKKGKKTPYKSEVDMWSIGCTLVFIACNCTAFAAQTADQIIELHKNRKEDTLLATYIGRKPIYSADFRRISPVNSHTSEALRNKYKEVIRSCFEPLEERSADKYFKIIEEIKDLCYRIDVNKGIGYYDLIHGESTNQTKKATAFSLRSVNHFCEALNIKVPIIFQCSGELVEISQCKFEAKITDTIGSQSQIVRSSCQYVQCLVAIMERCNFDIKVLQHLALTILNDEVYDKFHDAFIAKANDLVSDIMQQHTDVSTIYSDMHNINRTLEIASLQTRCGTIGLDVGKKARCYKKLIHGISKGNVPGMLDVLCTAIAKCIADGCELKNKTVFS